jgi:hypothetical protein
MEPQNDNREWATETTRGRLVFNYNIRMLGAEFKGWELMKTVTMQEDKDVTEKVYLWQNKSNPGREMVRVDITERHDWRLAQESLREHLKHCMRPDIARGTKNLASVGDVNFAGREPQTDITAAVSFTRGNVSVTVSSVGEKTVDVSEMAAIVDRALSEAPTKAEQDKGLVKARAPKTVAVESDKAQVLIENLQKASPRGAWLKIIAPDGELSRKGDALIYVSPEGGKKPIGIYAVRGG